jgi:hypothetical protein
VLTRAATLTGSDRFVVENAKRIGEFYERLCDGRGGMSEIPVSRNEIVDAATVLKNFVVANAEQIRSFRAHSEYRHVYVQELVAEYIASHKK